MASKHYAIADCGGLARVSTPYKMNSRTKMGVGFDSLNGSGYFRFRHRHEKGCKSATLLSHRMIYYLCHGELPVILDHIDGDPLNNSIYNLRAATPSQNCMNKKPKAHSTSKYLGVSWERVRGKWHVSIKTLNSHKFLGRFTCEKEAAQAYNKAAVEHHGEFANLNDLS